MTFSAGSSSSGPNRRKDKQVMEVVEEQHKEEEEEDGFDDDLPPPMPEEEGEEVPKPEWFHVLVRTNFWESCAEHASENRAERCMFCIRCYQVNCPHCTHKEPGHRLLKVRRYVYRSVVLARDLFYLGLDVSRIQTYIINGQKVVHIRPMNRSSKFRPQSGTPRCKTCCCYLRTAPYLFCSLVCEGREDVSQDDYSGPEAERRYRSLQTNMLQEQEAGPSEEPASESEAEEPQNPVLHPAPVAAEQVNEEPPPPVDDVAEQRDVDEPPPPATRNPPPARRRRGRKQAEPARAPFF